MKKRLVVHQYLQVKETMLLHKLLSFFTNPTMQVEKQLFTFNWFIKINSDQKFMSDARIKSDYIVGKFQNIFE